MDVKGLTISHVKSHLQMYRSTRHDLGRQGMQESKYSSCKDNDVGGDAPDPSSKPTKEFLSQFMYSPPLPPLKRCWMETEAKSKSLGCCRTREGILCCGERGVSSLYCVADYTQQAMVVDKRIKEEGLLRYLQRDAVEAAGLLADANTSMFTSLGCMVEESEPFIKANKQNEQQLHTAATKNNGSEESYITTGSPLFRSGSFGTESVEEKAAKHGDCSLSLSLSLDPRSTSNASPASESSGVFFSSSRRSFSKCSDYNSGGGRRINLDLSMSICGS
ncbi:uncharacterized protein LOC109714566 [Ananas comosus]|uniref:Uncharacterized protein LOC109714566 n=1 Tax=Ananas comosus TaxID=4615 RepID=A0A6P5FFV8_ANACO|nr:uncharacterized protein LOC109714566 [Ananas comosus]